MPNTTVSGSYLVLRAGGLHPPARLDLRAVYETAVEFRQLHAATRFTGTTRNVLGALTARVCGFLGPWVILALVLATRIRFPSHFRPAGGP